ncbi:DUF1275 family protein [Raineyella sp. W15-4]|uniref:DUF1275 family protein n=1 Tax=Raineyella sp. W15-4 TaxID=3081651 RepID=UPI002955BE2E|nr:DUF1275 family protein [Raineyella sp. W15-4]WOQ18741.1 DUF1275 family protein [Raineyella sp. W15-4]
MKSHLVEAWETLVPPKGGPHGPLPPLLLLLTVVTGLVDAFSYLVLGRVFVANMTGNVVFLSFALGGAPGFTWWAFLGGRVASRVGHHRGRHLLVGTLAQMVLVLVALVLALSFPIPPVNQSYTGLPLGILIALLGAAWDCRMRRLVRSQCLI